jgi:hypothetical protein
LVEVERTLHKIVLDSKRAEFWISLDSSFCRPFSMLKRETNNGAKYELILSIGKRKVYVSPFPQNTALMGGATMFDP